MFAAMHRTAAFALLSLVYLLVCVPDAAAQGADADAEDASDGDSASDGGGSSGAASSDNPLEAAEEAYLNIDFEAVGSNARQALERGGYRPDEVVRIYKLIGMAAAAQEQEQEAKDAFVRMLMLDPDAEVTELSPALRGPYLEARGRINAVSSRFGVEVGLSRPQESLIINLSDPMRLAAQIIVVARSGGRGDFVETSVEADSRVATPVTGVRESGWAEYSVAVRDQYGNLLAGLGTPDTPLTIGEPIVRLRDDSEESGGILSEPLFWIVSGAILLGGLAVGGYFLFFDEPSYDGQTSICFGECLSF